MSIRFSVSLLSLGLVACLVWLVAVGVVPYPTEQLVALVVAGSLVSLFVAWIAERYFSYPALLARRNGLVLVVGAPGSGKNVCVLNGINRFARRQRRIVHAVDASLSFRGRMIEGLAGAYAAAIREAGAVLAQAARRHGDVILLNEVQILFGGSTAGTRDARTQLAELAILSSQRNLVVLTTQSLLGIAEPMRARLLAAADVLVVLRSTERHVHQFVQSRTFAQSGLWRRAFPAASSFKLGQACVSTRRRRLPTDQFAPNDWHKSTFESFPPVGVNPDWFPLGNPARGATATA